MADRILLCEVDCQWIMILYATPLAWMIYTPSGSADISTFATVVSNFCAITRSPLMLYARTFPIFPGDSSFTVLSWIVIRKSLLTFAMPEYKDMLTGIATVISPLLACTS